MRPQSFFLVVFFLIVDFNCRSRARDLKIATFDEPPYVRDAAGVAAGPFVDLIKGVCARTGVGCEIDLVPFRRSIAELESGEVDAVFPLMITPERRSSLLISEPVFRASLEFVSNAGSHWAYQPDADYGDRVVGVFGPSATSRVLEDLLHSRPSVVIEVEPDNVTVMRKLAGGRYGPDGLALMNRDLALYLAQALNLPPPRFAGTAKSVGYAIGFSKRLAADPAVLTFLRTLAQTPATLRPDDMAPVSSGITP